MELVLIGLVLLALWGFVVGGLARWAVPGPDPMPVWKTILFGVVGIVVGGGLGATFLGEIGYIVGSLLVATLIVIAYRRFVQHRAITGPEAERPPDAPAADQGDALARLKKLGELRDAGLITPEEFAAKKAKIHGRI